MTDAPCLCDLSAAGKENKMSGEYVWKDRKRIIFGLPWSFKRYRLTETKLIVDTGFFSRHEEEIRLYRIMDMTLKRSFGQRLWGLGTVHLCTADKSTPELDIVNIKRSRQFKDMLSDMVESEREQKRISAREFMGGELDGEFGSEDAGFDDGDLH